MNNNLWSFETDDHHWKFTDFWSFRYSQHQIFVFIVDLLQVWYKRSLLSVSPYLCWNICRCWSSTPTSRSQLPPCWRWSWPWLAWRPSCPSSLRTPPLPSTSSSWSGFVTSMMPFAATPRSPGKTRAWSSYTYLAKHIQQEVLVKIFLPLPHCILCLPLQVSKRNVSLSTENSSV